ncbi:hypothetical protein [Actinoalloteichus hymeniacidonis]|uniref:Uncharacterized protein n=1 Tax=Actinoalloteichus hymeniacidonis TaxID=340345 RepID=A0AAC9MXX6_9PSEU|nr:hypothetical protein [Actinoalloteichus hymeniacidonis]AOS62730.1 hypothetical protein TL08_09575 [Actinoalloteichus hymeniacidonis]MBB5909239.1 hypothetical protein [Actinoalloteichus hymeniacidonis]
MQNRDQFGMPDGGRVEPATPPMGIRLPAGGPGAQSPAGPYQGEQRSPQSGWEGGQAPSARVEPVTPPMGNPLPLSGAGTGAAFGGSAIGEPDVASLIGDDSGHAAPAVIGGEDPFGDAGDGDTRDWPTLQRTRDAQADESADGGKRGNRMFGRRDG